MDFVKVKGKSFYYNDEEIRFKGLGIGSWLNIEHFMVGLPTTENQMKRTIREAFGHKIEEDFFSRYYNSFIAEEDFVFLKEIGVNLLRVPFHYHLFIDDQAPEKIKNSGFFIFDRLMEFSRKYQIFILPDLHSVPGGQNPDWHSDNQTGYPQFWHYKVFRTQMVELWKVFAERYKNEPYLLGYDVLNEPFLIPKDDQINEFYFEVTEAIRQVDQNHILFIEGDFFAMDFSCIHEIYDEQTALTFHYYPTVWHPDLLKKEMDRMERKQMFESVFLNLIKIRDAFERPILCGEAGYDIDREDIMFTIGLVEDTLELFEKHKVSWTLWSYKDAQLIGLVYPKTESPWMKFVKKIGVYWNHYLDIEMAQKTIQYLCDHYFKDTTDEERYLLQFPQRAIIYRLQETYWLKQEVEKFTDAELLKLPDSFLLSNCDFYEDYANMLKKYMINS